MKNTNTIYRIDRMKDVRELSTAREWEREFKAKKEAERSASEAAEEND